MRARLSEAAGMLDTQDPLTLVDVKSFLSQSARDRSRDADTGRDADRRWPIFKRGQDYPNPFSWAKPETNN